MDTTFSLEFDKLLSKELCDHIIRKFENDNRKVPGTVGFGMSVARPDLKKSTDLCLNDLEDWKDICHEIRLQVKRGLQKYLAELNAIFKNTDHQDVYHDITNKDFFDDGIVIQKIDENNKYAWHHDETIDKTSRCLFNVLIYLNTKQEGEGGTTQFANGKIIKPECGKMLIFPANWMCPHRGNKVNKGSKYICTLGLFYEL